MTSEQIPLEADERVLLEVRKHWFVLASQLGGIVLAAFVPPLVYIGISAFKLFPAQFTDYPSVLITLYIGWLIMMWMSLFSIWTNYYLDVWTITNRRLIATNQHGFFSRTIGSFRFERLQDVEVTVNGFLATILDYGTLETQTAGTQDNFIAYDLPKPSEIKALILSSTDALLSRDSEKGQSVS